MPTIVSESIQIDSTIYNEYKEQFATPYFSGSELAYLETFYSIPFYERHRSNTVELYPTIRTQFGVGRYWEISNQFANNVISASYGVQVYNQFFNI